MLLDQLYYIFDGDPVGVVMAGELLHVHFVQVRLPVLHALWDDNPEPLGVSLDRHLLPHQLFVQEVLHGTLSFLLVHVGDLHLVSQQQLLPEALFYRHLVSLVLIF